MQRPNFFWGNNMSIELKMPALSPTMEKGTLAKWLVAVGDAVRPGDLIAEIETDKATMEFEAIDEGVVSSLVIAEGTDDVAVGTVIALLSVSGEAVAAPAEPVAEVAVVKQPSVEIAKPVNTIAVPTNPSAVEADAVTATDASVSASPLARRIATAKGLSLSAIRGTGPRGRIVKADLGLTPVLTQEKRVAVAPTTAVVSQAPAVGVPFDTIKLSTMRKTIARRLTEAKQTIPHFYLTARCNLDALLKLRVALNESLASKNVRLSVNDMLIKGMSLALQLVPDANVQFGGEELYRFNRVDIAMAVAIEGGLVTPVIRDTGVLSLSAISQKSKALAALARDGKLMPEDYQGGTASISNLGMFGIDEMFPVINPPQSLILGVGAGVEQPWKVDGAIALATVIALTASFDHRAIDGATAAQFMAALRDMIENPMQIVA
jgi:pyruvate dehydrogenase E2 component (dihydrolipoamide acetyltransferase)